MTGAALLVLAITFSSGVAMAMKAANARRLHVGQFLAVNYLVCSVGLLSWGAWRTLALNSIFIWALGIVVGIMYVLCLWLFNRAIEAGGLALSTTLMRLSAAVPTLGSLTVFGEPASPFQLLGMVLAFGCLPLAGKEPLHPGRAGRGMIWGLLLFAAYGLTDFAFKVQAELEPAADPDAFIATIFGTALVLTVPHLFNGATPSRQCLCWGALLGLANVLATFFWVRALVHIPGSVAFPTLGLGVIVVTTVASLVIWRERLRPANWVFLGLASASVLMINFG